jgi:hypothetical protein
MLIGTNEVANRLKISNRAVQIKCKRAGLVKIGNQFQITEEVAEKWYSIADAKERTETEPKEKISKSSQRTNANTSVNPSLLFIIIGVIFLVLVMYIVADFKDQISYLKNENIKDGKMYNNELKTVKKQLKDATDVINNQQLEIQYLKIKDSIRTRPKL